MSIPPFDLSELPNMPIILTSDTCLKPFVSRIAESGQEGPNAGLYDRIFS